MNLRTLTLLFSQITICIASAIEINVPSSFSQGSQKTLPRAHSSHDFSTPAPSACHQQGVTVRALHPAIRPPVVGRAFLSYMPRVPLTTSSYSQRTALKLSAPSLRSCVLLVLHYWHRICDTLKNTSFKGAVHPKMKTLSSFTRPQVVPNLYEFIFSVEHRRRIFWRMLEQFMIPIHIP